MLPDPFWCGPLLLLTARLQLSICARCVLWQVAVLVSAGRQRRGIGSTSSCAEQQCSLAPPVNSPCRWQALEMSPFMRVVLQTGCAEQSCPPGPLSILSAAGQRWKCVRFCAVVRRIITQGAGIGTADRLCGPAMSPRPPVNFECPSRQGGTLHFLVPLGGLVFGNRFR